MSEITDEMVDRYKSAFQAKIDTFLVDKDGLGRVFSANPTHAVREATRSGLDAALSLAPSKGALSVKIDGLHNVIVDLQRQLAEANEDCKRANEMINAAIDDYNEARKALDDLERSTVPISADGKHIFMDGTGDVELDHGGKMRKALERIAAPGTVAGMHEQDRDTKLQQIARAALQGEERK